MRPANLIKKNLRIKRILFIVPSLVFDIFQILSIKYSIKFYQIRKSKSETIRGS